MGLPCLVGHVSSVGLVLSLFIHLFPSCVSSICHNVKSAFLCTSLGSCFTLTVSRPVSRVLSFPFVSSYQLSCQVKGSIQVSGYQVLVFCVQLSAVYVFISHPSLLLPFALQYFVQPTIKASTSPLSAFGSSSFSSHNLPLHIMTQTGESAFVQLKNFPILKPCFTTHRRRFFWQFF